LKSPIKDNPLHNPAESLDREIDKIINDKVNQDLTVLAMLMVLVFWDWWTWFKEVDVHPINMTIAALLIAPIFVYRILKHRRKVTQLRLGRDGEKAVGQYLERLRETSAKVFHDIPAKGFNIDHLVIAKSGIYVVETKTYSKSDDSSHRIIFDGSKLTLGNGYKTDKPITQVRAASSWVRELLKETTGKHFSTKPVIVFPGWFIELTSEAKSSDVWVLNPKGLPTFIANSSQKLDEPEVSLIAYHISRYIRAYKA
jgi:hypothetical protein